jgi:hypothetical protein
MIININVIQITKFVIHDYSTFTVFYIALVRYMYFIHV